MKQITKLFKEQVIFTIALIVIGAAIGAQSSKFLPSGFNKSQLFFLTLPQTESQANYFAPYYSQENARNFTDTAIGLLQSPEFLKEALSTNTSVSVQKVAPQLIRITVQSKDGQNLDEPLAKIPDVFNEKISQISQDTSAVQLKPAAPASKLAYFALSRPILLAVGAILGLLASLTIIGLKVYLKL